MKRHHLYSVDLETQTAYRNRMAGGKNQTVVNQLG